MEARYEYHRTSPIVPNPRKVNSQARKPAAKGRDKTAPVIQINTSSLKQYMEHSKSL